MLDIFRKVYPIGLDIGNSSIRMIQLARSGDMLKVIAASEKMIPANACEDPEARREAIKSLIAESMVSNKFVGKDVVAALSNSDLVVKSLRTEFSEGQELEYFLEDEAKDRFSIDSDKYEMNHIIAGEVSMPGCVRNEVILFAAPKQSIIDRLDLIEDSGLCAVSIDALPCALFRSILPNLRRETDLDSINVIVDVGSLYTTIVIGKGREIMFVKIIPFGGKRFNEIISSRLGITMEEAALLRRKMNSVPSGDGENMPMNQSLHDAMIHAISELANEISLCFRYYSVTFRGHRPDVVILSGGEAYEGVLLDSLKQKMGMNIELASPLRHCFTDGLKIPKMRGESRSEWAVAVGLARKGISINSSRKVCNERY